MSTGIVAFMTVFVLAAFVGNEVISKVPSVLHTPLMSGSNAIHGIILVGTMIVMGEARGAAQITLAFFAVLLATLNVVGGFVVTDRMLEMFKGKPSDRPRPAAGSGSGTSEASPSDAPSAPGGPTAQGTPGTPDGSGDSTPGDAK
jgi:NAD(P) transhydrogenase subunit alpha